MTTEAHDLLGAMEKLAGDGQLHVVVSPGTEQWAPEDKDVERISRRLGGDYTVNLHPRADVGKVWEGDHPGKKYTRKLYDFRAYQFDKQARIFVDETETQESVLWVIVHELVHMILRNQLPHLYRIYQKLTPVDYYESDDAHERDLEEQLANSIAQELTRGVFDRPWWRKRVEEMIKEAEYTPGLAGAGTAAAVLGAARLGREGVWRLRDTRTAGVDAEDIRRVRKASGVRVPIRRDEGLRGGRYELPTKKTPAGTIVLGRDATPGTLAHESVHARKGRAGRLLARIARPAFRVAPLAGIATSAVADPDSLPSKVAPALVGAAMTPTVLEEARANVGALRVLRRAGYPKGVVRQAARNMAVGQSWYTLAALGGVGATVATTAVKKRLTKEAVWTAQAQNILRRKGEKTPTKTAEVTPLRRVEKPETWTGVVQDHRAKKARRHYDLRLGDPQSGIAHSWALPKHRLPEPGDRPVLAVQTEDHSIPYMNFQGRIGQGYGSGTVRRHLRDKAEIQEARPGKVNFAMGGQDYAMRQVGEKVWLMRNTTESMDMPEDFIDKAAAAMEIPKLAEEPNALFRHSITGGASAGALTGMGAGALGEELVTRRAVDKELQKGVKGGTPYGKRFLAANRATKAGMLEEAHRLERAFRRPLLRRGPVIGGLGVAGGLLGGAGVTYAGYRASKKQNPKAKYESRYNPLQKAAAQGLIDGIQKRAMMEILVPLAATAGALEGMKYAPKGEKARAGVRGAVGVGGGALAGGTLGILASLPLALVAARKNIEAGKTIARVGMLAGAGGGMGAGHMYSSKGRKHMFTEKKWPKKVLKKYPGMGKIAKLDRTDAAMAMGGAGTGLALGLGSEEVYRHRKALQDAGKHPDWAAKMMHREGSRIRPTQGRGIPWTRESLRTADPRNFRKFIAIHKGIMRGRAHGATEPALAVGGALAGIASGLVLNRALKDEDLLKQAGVARPTLTPQERASVRTRTRWGAGIGGVGAAGGGLALTSRLPARWGVPLTLGAGVAGGVAGAVLGGGSAIPRRKRQQLRQYAMQKQALLAPISGGPKAMAAMQKPGFGGRLARLNAQSGYYGRQGRQQYRQMRRSGQVNIFGHMR